MSYRTCALGMALLLGAVPALALGQTVTDERGWLVTTVQHRVGSRSSSTLGGYLYARSVPEAGGTVSEHRLYAQYAASLPAGG